MNEEIIIVTPELSPAAGGVADYTLRLLENWPGPANFKILIAQSDRNIPSSFSYSVEKLGTDSLSILSQLPPKSGKVFLQYSAYGFDRFGYPRELLRALIDWKKKTHGRLVIMFHEIWTFWSPTNKNFFVQFFHRRALKRLLDCADHVFTSTQNQAEHLGKLSGKNPIHVLPVGSNVRRHEDVDLSRMPGHAVIFGLQRARVRGLRKWEARLNSLAAVGRIRKIIAVGAGSDPMLAKEETALLGALPLKEGFKQRGALPDREISKLLLSASFGIFAHDELSLTKSGTFMAYAAHELNVLADFADQSKPPPICWLVTPSELLTGISEPELKRRAEELFAWQRRVCSWKLISEKFAQAL
jgi:hypothetical protein